MGLDEVAMLLFRVLTLHFTPELRTYLFRFFRRDEGLLKL